MATVRIGKQLLENVDGMIQKMRETAVKELGPVPMQDRHWNMLNPAQQKAVIDTVWGAHIDLAQRMPEKWMVKTRSVRIKFRTDSLLSSFSVDEPNVFFPPGTNNYNCEVHMANDHPAFVEEVTAKEAHYKASRELIEKYNKIKEDVKAFLEQHGSLNAAIKTWQGIKLYIPKNYLEEVERKVERNKPTVIAEELPDIDFAELAIVGATHRMTGG